MLVFNLNLLYCNLFYTSNTEQLSGCANLIFISAVTIEPIKCKDLFVYCHSCMLQIIIQCVCACVYNSIAWRHGAKVGWFPYTGMCLLIDYPHIQAVLWNALLDWMKVNGFCTDTIHYLFLKLGYVAFY